MKDPRTLAAAWLEKQGMSDDDYRRMLLETIANLGTAGRAALTAVQSLTELAENDMARSARLKQHARELEKVIPVCKEAIRMLR